MIAMWLPSADCMDRAIDMHNTCVRKVLDDFAGHEIRNEGDSFVIAFHEAEDGVRFALRLQERLTALEWPQVQSQGLSCVHAA
jgi:class 3 adenylate cyclase